MIMVQPNFTLDLEAICNDEKIDQSRNGIVDMKPLEPTADSELSNSKIMNFTNLNNDIMGIHLLSSLTL